MTVVSVRRVNRVKVRLRVPNALPVPKKHQLNRAVAVVSHVSKKICKRAAKPVKRVKTANHAVSALSAMTVPNAQKARQNSVRAMSARHVNVSHAKKLQPQPLKRC